jgi:hypothetical protein
VPDIKSFFSDWRTDPLLLCHFMGGVFSFRNFFKKKIYNCFQEGILSVVSAWHHLADDVQQRRKPAGRCVD